MPIDFDDVRPGDLITAEFINHVLTTLEALDARVAVLEESEDTDSGSVRITGVFPSGTLTVGQEIVVVGQNFEFSMGAHRVTVAGQRVSAFRAGTSDGQLIFEVPGLPDLSEPSPITLRVENRSSFDTAEVTVQPVQDPLVGSVDVSLNSVAPERIAQGASATFTYALRSRLNRRATLLLTPAVTVATTPPRDWSEHAALLTEDLERIANGYMSIDPGEALTVRVRIDEVPSGSEGMRFMVRLEAAADGTTVGASEEAPFTVGEAVTPPDDTVTLASPSLGGTDGDVTLDGTSLQMASSASALVRLVATFTAEGTYDLTANLPPDARGWTARVFQQQPNPITISTADLRSGAVDRNVQFVVDTATSELSPATVTFRVQRRGADRSRTFMLDLVPQS